MNKIDAERIAGTLSSPSKIPCKSYSIPALACKTGGKLRKIDGSVCSKCYASKGCYLFKSTRDAMARRLKAIRHTLWVPAMVELIKAATTKTKYFRWHDSGDIQSVAHLNKIVEIARRLPDVTFWLPTKEAGIISKSKKVKPDNLVIRLSAPMVDGKPAARGNTSTVTTNQMADTCPATLPGSSGECGACRKCWDGTIKNISYLLH